MSYPSAEYISETKEWIQGIYKNIESGLNPDIILDSFTEDATINFSNYPTLKGKKGLGDISKWYFESFTSIKHNIKDIRIHNDQIIITAEHIYNLKSGTEQKLKLILIIHKKPGEKATGLDTYADTSELFKSITTFRGAPPL